PSGGATSPGLRPMLSPWRTRQRGLSVIMARPILAHARAQTAAEEEVAAPADQAERQEGPERSGVVAQQEMELLEMPPFPRELAAQRQGGEGDREGEQPPLPAEEAPRPAQRPELELRREIGRYDLGEALRPLQADAP